MLTRTLLPWWLVGGLAAVGAAVSLAALLRRYGPRISPAEMAAMRVALANLLATDVGMSTWALAPVGSSRSQSALAVARGVARRGSVAVVRSDLLTLHAYDTAAAASVHGMPVATGVTLVVLPRNI